MFILGQGEIVQKFNRIDGALVEDNLGFDLNRIDDAYFYKYLQQKHYSQFSQKSDCHIDDNFNINEDIDYYNGYNEVYYEGYEYDFDEDDEIEIVKDSIFNDDSDEVFKTRITPKYIYVLTSHKTQLIQCDKCKEIFCDYNGLYNKYSKRRKTNKDYCISCWSEKNRIKSMKLSRMAKALEKYNGIMASKNQRYIAQLLNGTINHKIGDWYGDILIDNNIIIEYDGGGHFIAIERYQMSLEEFKEKEKLREIYFNDRGYKIIRIISKKDYLPSDNDILDLINQGKEQLKNKYVVKFEINPTKYKSLRKIREEELKGYYGRNQTGHT